MDRRKVIAAAVGGMLAIGGAVAWTLFGVQSDFQPIIDLLGK